MSDDNEIRHDTQPMNADEIREAIAGMDRMSTLPPPGLVPVLLEAQLVPEPPKTGEPCPVCAACECCGGIGIVEREKFEQWARAMVKRDIDEAQS